MEKQEKYRSMSSQLSNFFSCCGNAILNPITLFHASAEYKRSKIREFDPEQLNIKNSCALQKIIRHAYETVPFYQILWKKTNVDINQVLTYNDLSIFPLVSKNELEQQPLKNLISKKSRPMSLGKTSGTTGNPRQFLRDETALIYNHVTVQRYFEDHGVALGSTVLFIHSGSDGPTPMRAMPNERFSCRISISVSDLLNTPELAAQLNADVVVGSPQQIEVVAQLVYAANQIRFPKMFVNIAERLDEGARQRVEKITGSKIVDVYCSSELSTLIGFECRNHRGFHINWDYLVVEILDQKGQEVEPGQQGEVVVTDLYNFVSPIIRYRLGDIVTKSDSFCPCGRALPLLISQVNGRVIDQIRLSNGSALDALPLINNLQVIMNCQLTLVQESYDNFTLKCYWTANQLDISKDNIEESIRHYIGSEKISLKICSGNLSTVLLDTFGKVRPFLSYMARNTSEVSTWSKIRQS